MKFLNLDNRDYHMHSSTFSDGLSTIDEIVKFAWEMWMTEIAITDHSQATMDNYRKKLQIYASWTRCILSLSRWGNVYNDVNVIFWVECDLLNEDWDVCFDIQWKESNYNVLSAHKFVYNWNKESVTEWLINAVKRYHEKIKFIAHPCSITNFWNEINIEKIVSIANEYNIPLEFNATYFSDWKTHMGKLDYLLKNANEVYVNSDWHTLHEIKENRKKAIEFLRENKYI
jgi:histidinol phosphatase-like PHP family hydrolase